MCFTWEFRGSILPYSEKKFNFLKYFSSIFCWLLGNQLGPEADDIFAKINLSKIKINDILKKFSTLNFFIHSDDDAN